MADTTSQQRSDSTSTPSHEEEHEEIEVLMSDSDDDEDDEEVEKAQGSGRLSWQRLLLHLVCILIYLLPVLMPSAYNKGNPVLDELHITSNDNLDVNGNTTLETIFTNDYWGRPMNSSSSHKSWRPLTVLSFRYLKGGRFLPDLLSHRLVNIITHACVAELVSILAIKLVPTTPHLGLLKTVVKILWALHPTHVEVTANSANRPHLLAVLCSVTLSDPDVPLLVFLFMLVAGYLSCETFLFQVVPAAVTLSAIHYIRLYLGPFQLPKRGSLLEQLLRLLSLVWFRVGLLAASGVVYYAGRYYLDWLSIPEGLIRPAENPFYEFVGWERVRNYSYVLAIHVAKAWDLDFIGFSHEYGRECIRPIRDWRDSRLAIPMGIAWLHVVVFVYFARRQRRSSVLSHSFLLYLVYLSWMVTLFPISGIVKVGTFIADRIVVASTVAVSILVSSVVVQWVQIRPKDTKRTRQRLLVLIALALFMWKRIFDRTTDWMDSKTLLESSLKTCPRFAKAHLETSKIYSGLYPELLNLTKSRWHLRRVEDIDPDFCDVHYQYAHVAVQQHLYAEFEEQLTKALMCPFSMAGAMSLWNNYWSIAMNPKSNPPQLAQAARERYEKFMATINAKIAEEEAKGGESPQKSASPLVGWKREL